MMAFASAARRLHHPVSPSLAAYVHAAAVAELAWRASEYVAGSSVNWAGHIDITTSAVPACIVRTRGNQQRFDNTNWTADQTALGIFKRCARARIPHPPVTESTRRNAYGR